MDVRIEWTKTVLGDGRHNAFTGIGAGFGETFVAFRSASGHMEKDGAIRILATADGASWEERALVEAPGVDLRDPKLASFRGELWAFFAHQPAGGPRAMRAGRSADGRRFGEAVDLRGGLPGAWLWHGAECGGRLYGSAYRRRHGRHWVSLHASDDGVEWAFVADFPVPGNETWLDFDAEGTLWALVRDDFSGCMPTLCVARPPYGRFEAAAPLPMRLQGPMLKRLRGGCLIVCRQWDGLDWSRVRTDVVWVADGRAPVAVATLPSGGDTSYAAWLDVAPGRAWVSYYSSHGYPEEGLAVDGGDERIHPANVHLAEIAYSDGGGP